MTAIKAIKDDSVIVFIDGSNLHLTPKQVQDYFASDTASGALPIVAIFDHAIEKKLGVLPYQAIRARDGFKDVKAEIAKVRGKVPETGKQTSS